MAQQASSGYTVPCHHCGQSFDASEADWCSCLSKDRTFTCPHCLRCFCDAPRSKKQKFWENAPDEIWTRKFARPEAASYENPSPDDLKRPAVLVVDDEQEVREIAIHVIESLGYGLVVATDGEEGEEMARRYQPDLVLTDAMMPKVDGREMGRRIKEGAGDGKKPVVVVMTSLYTDPRYKHEALRNFSIDEYLAKPLKFSLLREVLERHLGQA